MLLSKRMVQSACALSALMMTSAFADRTGNFGQANFNVSMRLFNSIQVEKLTDMSFGDHMLTGTGENIIVHENDANAASFRATGDRNADVVVQVLEDTIKLTSPEASGSISVDNWTYGGNVNGQGIGKFDVTGALPSIRVGATAHLSPSTEYGAYSGSATLRVTYI